MKTIDKYLFQALDNYPYSLEETIESLDYAFSYDARNTMVLCLYGRIQAEQLWNYDEAKSYFQEAQKLVEFALTIKGINKSEIFVKKAILFEAQLQFEEALAAIKNAKLYTLQFAFESDINEVEKRIKNKKELLEKKKKPKKSKKDSKRSK